MASNRKHSYNEYFTIFNRGTPHSFNPNKRTIDHRTNKEKTLLEIHQEYVRDARNSLVFIVDNHGERL